MFFKYKFFKNIKNLSFSSSRLSLTNYNANLLIFKIAIKSFSTEIVKREEYDIFLKKVKRKPDRYGILKMNNYKQLLNIFQSPTKNLTLNEDICVLFRIIQITENSQLKDIYGLTEIIHKTKNRLKSIHIESPFIGRLIYTLSNMDFTIDDQFKVR